MRDFDRDDLVAIMRECLGEADLQLSDTDLDTEFFQLGCDSLLVLEISSRIQDRYQVRIPDEAITEMSTPNEMLHSVRSRVAGV